MAESLVRPRGDGTPGKVERPIFPVANHFYDLGLLHLPLDQRSRQSADHDSVGTLRSLLECTDGCLDVIGFEKRKVSLHVDDDIGIEVARHLRDSIRARRVLRCGHTGLTARIRDSLGDPPIVGCDQNPLHTAGHSGSLEDPHHHGLTADVGQGLAR